MAANAAAPVDAILEWNEVMLEANANDHALASPEQGGPIKAITRPARKT